MTDKKALKLLCMFALPPVALGRCGRERKPTSLQGCVIKGECEGVEEQLRTFFVLYPYLRTIAKVTKKEEFSLEVAEAYWLGSSLLNEFTTKHFDLLLENLGKQGTPEDFLKEVKRAGIKDFAPTHLFQLLFVSSYGSFLMVRDSISHINDCMVRPAKVFKVGKRTLKVSISILSATEEALTFSQEDVSVKYNSKLLPEIKKDDIVAIHWQNAVRILSRKENTNLIFWNAKVVEIFNRHIKKGKENQK